MRSDIYLASFEGLSKIRGRYTLKLYLTELNKKISIDIHDSLCETLGVSFLSNTNIQKIAQVFPRRLNITRFEGYWEIVNEGQILSDTLSKICLDI